MSWPAPSATASLRAGVRLPGSKSITNRALLLAALADGPSRVRNPLRARDTELMADALRALGVGVEDVDADWLVTPGPLHGARIDVGLAGTVMRFVPPLAALADGEVHLDGDERARDRPMNSLIDGLRQLGVTVEDGGRGTLPLTLHGHGAVTGGDVAIDASASSQFVSGLLLAAPRYGKGLRVRHTGPAAVPSQPHIDMTLGMLGAAGVTVRSPAPDVWEVEPGPIAARDVTVEPDLSNAAPFLAAALVAGGSVTVADWPHDSVQPGGWLPGVLAGLGAEVSWADDGLTVTGRGVHGGVVADMGAVGELTPVVAALCALGTEPSHLSGIAHLRGHETDRLAAIAEDLAGLGGRVEQTDDGLVITPVPLHGGLWRAYADHRMAQAGALIGLAVPGVQIDDIASTGKTMADFPGLWHQLLSA